MKENTLQKLLDAAKLARGTTGNERTNAEGAVKLLKKKAASQGATQDEIDQAVMGTWVNPLHPPEPPPPEPPPYQPPSYEPPPDPGPYQSPPDPGPYPPPREASGDTSQGRRQRQSTPHRTGYTMQEVLANDPWEVAVFDLACIQSGCLLIRHGDTWYMVGAEQDLALAQIHTQVVRAMVSNETKLSIEMGVASRLVAQLRSAVKVPMFLAHVAQQIHRTGQNLYLLGVVEGMILQATKLTPSTPLSAAAARKRTAIRKKFADASGRPVQERTTVD